MTIVFFKATILDLNRRKMWTITLRPRMEKKIQSYSNWPSQGEGAAPVSWLCYASDMLAPVKAISAYSRKIEQISL